MVANPSGTEQQLPSTRFDFRALCDFRLPSPLQIDRRVREAYRLDTAPCSVIVDQSEGRGQPLGAWRHRICKEVTGWKSRL
jgi:hypothetical protein